MMKQEVYNMFGNILKKSNVRFLKERKNHSRGTVNIFYKNQKQTILKMKQQVYNMFW